MPILSNLTFLVSIFIFVVGISVLLKNKDSLINASFAFICLSSFMWLFAVSKAYSIGDQHFVLFWFKVATTGMILTAPAFYQFAVSFLKLEKQHWVYWGGYAVSFIFIFLTWNTTTIIRDLHTFSWGYYPVAGKCHPLFLMFFFFFGSYSLYQLNEFYKRSKSSVTVLRRQQIKYIILSLGIYLVSAIDLIPFYGINILPFGFIPIALFLLIISYALSEYRLMDRSLVITRDGVFLAVYSILLSIPFLFAFSWQRELMEWLNDMWWVAPMISSTVLATSGPFIYLYIQKKAEDKILYEQRQYQKTLRDASVGRGEIKDLKRLLKLIVHVVSKSVQIEHCEIYLYHSLSHKYVLKATRGKDNIDPQESNSLPEESVIIDYLKQFKEPILYDEIHEGIKFNFEGDIREIERTMNQLKAALVVPCFIEENMIGIIVLGKKRSKKLYSHDDLAVFTILANQSALAIENAQFFEEMQKTHEQIFKAEKMATIGTMADGLSHQINNRLHAMGFIAGDALDSIRIKKDTPMKESTKELLAQIEHALLRIEENVKRGGEIVSGLLQYTRKGEEGFSDIDFNKLLDATFEMAQFKIKLGELTVQRRFEDDVPKIKGNFTQLQEAFFNMIDNAYDAMIQKENELKDPACKPTLIISARRKGKNIEIILNDNGMGVKDADMNKLFTPFFSTKAAMKKGTGLGLYVIKQIIEENHDGKILFTSKYQIGSQSQILLPAVMESEKAV